MDINADQAFAVKRLRQIGVKIHVISAKLSQTLAPKQVIGKAFDLSDRVETVENAVLYIGPRRFCPIDNAAN